MQLSRRPMRLELSQSLEDYVKAGDETTAELFAAGSPYRKNIDNMHAYFISTLFAGDTELRPVPSFLALNSLMLWLSSVRMTMTGHAAATYPLFRVALESPCYALVTQRDETKEAIWIQRDSSPEAAKRCRLAMTGAAKDAADIVNADQPGSGNIVVEGYQTAIDWGAHPNAKSIFHHMTAGEHADERFWSLSLSTLGAHDSREVRRTLIASLEFGFAIGSVLLRAIENATQEQADALGKLHDDKESLAASWFVTAPQRASR